MIRRIAAGFFAAASLGGAMLGACSLRSLDDLRATPRTDGGIGVDAGGVGSACRSSLECTTHHCQRDERTGMDRCACPPGTTLSPRSLNGGSGKFCIDITEVTVSDYERAVVACEKTERAGTANGCPRRPIPSKDSPCAYDPAGRGGLPATCVTWNDARAYCTYVGKRLCNNFGDTLNSTESDLARAIHDEWYNACAKSTDGQPYPYGTSYLPRACNGRELDAGGPVNAGSLEACKGGEHGGVFDLSGNVAEWEDACDSVTGQCPARGGSYESNEMELRCNAFVKLDKETRRPDIGFRCCGG